LGPYLDRSAKDGLSSAPHRNKSAFFFDRHLCNLLRAAVETRGDQVTDANPSAQKSPSTVPKALATNIATQNADEGLSARASKPEAFAVPAIHVRSEFMIEARWVVGGQ
jgi:hypothetical protein